MSDDKPRPWPVDKNGVELSESAHVAQLHAQLDKLRAERDAIHGQLIAMEQAALAHAQVAGFTAPYVGMCELSLPLCSIDRFSGEFDLNNAPSRYYQRFEIYNTRWAAPGGPEFPAQIPRGIYRLVAMLLPIR